jgi:DNA polymerase III delta prime subunit
MSIVTFPNEFLFVEKYRPKTIDDCVLPSALKKTFKDMAASGRIGNLLFSGTAGVGKTTIGKALCEEIGAEYIIINGSENGGIDTIRYQVRSFASTISLTDSKKVIIIDESDGMSQDALKALRGSIEEFSSNCSFLFTCNYKAKIIEPIHSRCTCIDFTISKEDKQLMAATFFQRAVAILKNENIEFDPKVVAELVTKYFPDYRRTLNELQRYSASGKIDVGILVASSDSNLDSLFKAMKEKNFTETRKWVGENSDIEPAELFSRIYEKSNELFEPQSLPQLVLILGDYDYKSAFVTDKQIITMCALTEIMSSLVWK